LSSGFSRSFRRKWGNRPLGAKRGGLETLRSLLDSFDEHCHQALWIGVEPTPEAITEKKQILQELFWLFYEQRVDLRYRRHLFELLFK
jgi:hypothetical protein